MQNAHHKQTEIGEIPEEWKIVKLSDIARIEMGQSPKSEYYNGNCEGLPFLQGIKTFGDRYPYFETWCTKPTKVAEPGDILLSVRAPVGIVNISKDRLCIGRGVSAIRGKNTNFIYYLLRANSDKIDSRGTGTVYRSINKSDIQNLVFAIPPELEQQQIASILSSLDDKIELNRKMNKTLEDIGKALFKRWFVDFKFPDNDRQHKEVELKDIVDINPREELRKGETARYVEMKDLPEQGMWTYSETRKTYKGGSKFRNGDTLMARITPCLENGKSAFVNFLDTSEVAFGSTEFIVIRSKDKIYEEFAYCLVRDVEFREYAIKSMVGSSGRQRVQTDAIQHYQLYFPSIEAIDRFHTTIQPIFAQIKSNSLENINLAAIRDLLLPRLMSGKLRV